MVGPTPGRKLQHAEAGDAVARILGEAQERQHVLDVRGVEEFQPAEFDEGDVAPRQLDLERALWWEARKSTAWLFRGVPASRFFSTSSTT